MKKGFKEFLLFQLILLLTLSTAGCASAPAVSSDEGENKEPEKTVVGFSQLGAESDWRTANSESMRNTFSPENGYELLFEDGQQKQSNQITAIRTFIQRGVDYIVLAPVTETGWDTVLNEAKSADIPVIIMDRMVDVKEEDLYLSQVGSDFELEGKKACAWLKAYCDANSISDNDIHIVDVQGTIDSSAQIGRTNGLLESAEKYGWDLKEMVPADFTQAKGKEVTKEFLLKYEDVNVIYCENDNEALGAIEAIEAVGKKPGSNIAEGEIMVISFDGVREEILELVRKGTISCVCECNPDLGPKVKGIIELYESGEDLKKNSYADEKVYSGEDIESIIVNDKEYDVTILK